MMMFSLPLAALAAALLAPTTVSAHGYVSSVGVGIACLLASACIFIFFRDLDKIDHDFRVKTSAESSEEKLPA